MTHIMFLGDSPDTPSGLGRIGRDLASRLWEENVGIKVSYAGYWGMNDPSLNFPQYCLGDYHNDNDLLKILPAIQRAQPDVLFCIYDPFRLAELPRLVNEAWEYEEGYKAPKLWAYLPIDAEGIGDRKMTGYLCEKLKGFDRLLAYGPFGADVLEAALEIIGENGMPVPCPGIPHGVDFDVFRIHNQKHGRKLLGIESDRPILGVVATNQPRKDWGLVFQTLALLPTEWHLWAHTDKTIGYWSLPALALDLRISPDRVHITKALDDITLSKLYSACDVTFGPGLGEGFGYPLVESMACGTPAVHVAYAGGADLLPGGLLVQPVGMRVESAYGFLRPVLNPYTVEAVLLGASEKKDPSWCRGLVRRYSWEEVWPKWLEWFKGGI